MTKTNVQPIPSNSQHHDTPLLFAPSGVNHEQGLGWDRVCEAQRSAAMKAPVGLLSGSAVCDSRWRSVAPTSATPTRSLGKLAGV